MADKASIAAACPVCGTSRFHGPGETLEAADVLTCEKCGLKLSYSFLQSRIETPPAAPAPAPVEAPKRKKARKTTRKKRKRAA